MNADELINKLLIIGRDDLSAKTTELSNELFETLKIIENCMSCRVKKTKGNDFYEQINRTANYFELNDELFKINIRLNREILCECCKEKEIDKLTDKCENEEIARFLYYECKLNARYYYGY